MTYEKLPGVYFGETTTTSASYSQIGGTPLFIVQTSTAIASIDGKVTEFNSFNAFDTIAKNKGLTQTLKYIQNILTEAGKTGFYVYSIKTDTAAGFTEAITSTAHLDDVTTVIYIEETKSSNSNTITSKIGAIKSGLNNNSENGTFRVGYILPYGTVTDAVNNAGSGVTPSQAAVTSLTTITAGEGDGRICVAVPDSLGGSIVGKCVGTNYNEEPGYTGIGLLDLTGVYNFDYAQMLTLQNQGILFVRPEKLQGTTTYRINLGVTTSFKESKSDGLIVCRTITDEMLRQIRFAAQPFIKGPESETTLAELDAQISVIVGDFVDEESVIEDETVLTVADAGNSTFLISGTIKPVKSLIAIEVSTVLA